MIQAWLGSALQLLEFSLSLCFHGSVDSASQQNGCCSSRLFSSQVQTQQKRVDVFSWCWRHNLRVVFDCPTLDWFETHAIAEPMTLIRCVTAYTDWFRPKVNSLFLGLWKDSHPVYVVTSVQTKMGSYLFFFLFAIKIPSSFIFLLCSVSCYVIH